MRAFVSHESACDVLRLLFSGAGAIAGVSRWPRVARGLPPADECVCGQRSFGESGIGGKLRRLGLSERPVDLLVPSQAARSSGGEARFHVWGGILPAESLFLVSEDVLISGPELAIIQLCSTQGKLDALLDAHVAAVRAEAEVAALVGAEEKVIDHPLAWERIRRLVAATVAACEFAGTYRLVVGTGTVSYRAPKITSAAELGRVAAEAGKSQGTLRARRVSELMFDGSASPMETALALMLALPVDFGGFGLERPLLNQAVDVTSFRGALSDRDAVTPDFLWPGQGVALEYDSSEFHARRGEGRLSGDAVRANILTATGWRVFRATPQAVQSLPGLSLLARQLACALDVELPETTPLQDLRRRKLFMQLMPVRRG